MIVTSRRANGGFTAMRQSLAWALTLRLRWNVLYVREGDPRGPLWLSPAGLGKKSSVSN